MSSPGEGVSDGGAEVGELADSIEFIVVDGNDRRCFCILSQDIRLLASTGKGLRAVGYILHRIMLSIMIHHDSPKTLHLEYVQSLLCIRIQSPGFTAVGR